MAVRPRLDAINTAIHDHDDEFLWKNQSRLSSTYLLEWWDAEPNREVLLRLDVPLAIFHGDLDGTCRVEGVRETQDAFREKGKKNLTVHTYPDADHDLSWTHESLTGNGPPAFRDAFDLIARWMTTK